MLDITYLREHAPAAEDALRKRGVSADIQAILRADREYRKALQLTEELRAAHNTISERVARADGEERAKLIAESKELKEKLRAQEGLAENFKLGLEALLLELPNIPQDDVPSGGEEANVVARTVGEKPRFSFIPKDHMELGTALGCIDIERAAKVSGARFAYLKGDLALLEFALVRFAMDRGLKEGFIPVIPPVMIKEESMKRMGYVDIEADRLERYYLEKDKMYLVGTAEQSVGPMHQDEVFEEKDLPKRYIAFSTCFREEAGSYGKDTKGILRVHQFDKVELLSFAHPERSQEEHRFLLAFEEALWQALQIPYQVVQLAAGDMGRPSVSTIDIEAWLPGQGRYREVSSASNTTDFQARRLNTRFRDKNGKLVFVHILNATGFPVGRTLIAIMENYQQEDGSILVPEALRPYLGKERIERPRET